jgi:hypothetical protein
LWWINLEWKKSHFDQIIHKKINLFLKRYNVIKITLI